MEKIKGKNITLWPDLARDLQSVLPSYQETFGHIKKPDCPIDYIILTCNPTGPNIFYKNFINNENNKD